MNVIDIEKYTPKRGFECVNACLVNCLAFQNCDISSSDILFSVEDKNIYTFEDDFLYCNEPNNPFAEKYGIKLELKSTDQQNAKKVITNELQKNNSFLVVAVRPEILEYSLVFSENSQGYRHFINIVGADEKEVYFVDGYVFHVDDAVYSEHVNYEKFLKAWEMKKYLFCRVEIPDDLNVKGIKQEAKQHFVSYVQRDHEILMNSKEDDPEHDILRLFWLLKNKISRDNCIDPNYINHFITQVKVEGFLIIKNMIWEKLYEISPEYAEEYDQYIKRWNHLFMVIRKYTIRNKAEGIVALYENIRELVYEESTWLFDVVKKTCV